MKVPFYRINAFVESDSRDSLQSGNPAAVILLTHEQDQNLKDNERQAIACEMNLAETSFVSTPQSADHSDHRNLFNLRWFTPKAEVSLCGHATLAAMRALLSSFFAPYLNGDPREKEVHFQTLHSGILSLQSSIDLNGNLKISMRFPALQKHETLTEERSLQLLRALGIQEYRNNECEVEEIFQSDLDVVVHLKNDHLISKILPDFEEMKSIPWVTRGVVICAKDDKGIIKSRFFAPALGVCEDPVTGSAHCALAPLFLSVGESATAVQMSSRGGKLTISRKDRETVVLEGLTSVVIEGTIDV